jgi:TPR repeat protein
VLKDAKQAASWYQKAAEQGYAKAQSNLGAMYDFGKGPFAISIHSPKIILRICISLFG